MPETPHPVLLTISTDTHLMLLPDAVGRKAGAAEFSPAACDGLALAADALTVNARTYGAGTASVFVGAVRDRFVVAARNTLEQPQVELDGGELDENGRGLPLLAAFMDRLTVACSMRLPGKAVAPAHRRSGLAICEVISGPEQIAGVRHRVHKLALEAGFDGEAGDEICLVATEMSANVEQHGAGDETFWAAFAGERLLLGTSNAVGPPVELDEAMDRDGLKLLSGAGVDDLTIVCERWLQRST